ncbi:hypothetical protein [Sphingomonas sp. LT1P40]|uniref:hypothetical protein n=1 Tax=Alteristakelama amylovorans TaxID=3096166 RepID=UPI002FC6728C
MKRVATTPAEMATMIEQAVSVLPDSVMKLDAEGWPIPPWSALPMIKRRSIGWRMGLGEDYMAEFCDWFRTLTNDENERYVTRYPEPTEWSGFYSTMTED